MNKDGQKVDLKQLKENESCIKGHQKGKLGTSIEACLVGDSSQRVAKAEAKTLKDDAKLCAPLNPAPSFGYTGAAAVNGAAVAGPIDLIHAIFGDPVDAAPVLTTAVNKDTAKCQNELLKRANKLEDAVLKELVKAKKSAIKEPAVNSAAALETALGAVLSSNKKITKSQDQLMSKVDKTCASLQALPSTVFPGACAAPTLAEVEDCTIAAARCVACLKMNAFDGLNLNCDQADNLAADMSCPVTAEPTPTVTPGATPTPAPSPTWVPSPTPGGATPTPTPGGATPTRHAPGCDADAPGSDTDAPGADTHARTGIGDHRLQQPRSGWHQLRADRLTLR